MRFSEFSWETELAGFGVGRNVYGALGSDVLDVGRSLIVKTWKEIFLRDFGRL